MSRFNCPTCGETFSAEPIGDRPISCTHCGRVFAKPQSPSASDPDDVGDVPPTAEKEKRKRCDECGASMRSTVATCPDCGAEQPYVTAGDSSRRRRTRDDDRRRDDDYDDDRGRRLESRIRDASSKKLAAGLLAIFAGTFGIHKFVLGFTTPGLIYLISTIVTCGFAAIVLHLVALVEGIIYLSKSDEDFYYTYIVDKKEWF